MFPNLRAEMARYGIRAIDLSPVLKVTSDSVSNKLNGKSEFTRSEIFKIKKTFFPNLTLEYLFTTKEEFEKGA